MPCLAFRILIRYTLFGHPVIGASWEGFVIENQTGSAPRLDKGNRQAIQDIQPARSFVVYPGSERYPMQEGVEAIGLIELMNELRALAQK